MNTRIRVLAGLVLCACSIACSSSSRVVEAQTSTQSRTVRPMPSLNSSSRPEWRLGTPYTHNSLTVFPVLGDSSMTRADLITLDQGLRSGQITITELGAAGNSGTPGQRSGNNAEVNRLALVNKSGKPLVLIAGEMIVGGQQDRIVGHDCIIESSNTPVPLDVFCVEHGRWSGSASFVGNTATAESVNRDGIGQGSQNAEVVSIAAGLALPNIREKAQAKKSQQEVWNAVSDSLTVNSARNSTGDLNGLYMDKTVSAKLATYQDAFKNRLSGENVIGVVAAIGDKIISADVFANHFLFESYWPKILKSYALEALSANASGAAKVSKDAAEEFLARAQGENSTKTQSGVYRLAESQSSSHASFELEYGATPTLIHFNRVAKK
jgi:hypothetical protein